MDLTSLLTPLDNYCERTGPGFWGEPLNAVSNVGFLIAAGVVWRSSRRSDRPRDVRALAALLALIGLCSALFHTTAVVLTAVLDIAAIALFVSTVFYLHLRHRLAWPVWWAAAGVLAFLGTSALVPGSCWYGSCRYLPAFAGLVLLTLHALLRQRPVAGAFVCAIALFLAAVTLRTLDLPLCHLFPLGTHWVWHLLNAAVLTAVCHAHARPAQIPLTPPAS